MRSVDYHGIFESYIKNIMATTDTVKLIKANVYSQE